jgi:hypothetical protein
MFRGRFLGLLFAMLLVVGLLDLAGSSIYRAGWTQGYFVGKVSDGEAGETAVVTPDAVTPDSTPGRALHYGRGFSPADSFFETIVKCFLFLFLIGMFFKFIGLLMWRKGGQKGRRGWGHHGRWSKRHGHTPPWYDDESDEPMKA